MHGERECVYGRGGLCVERMCVYGRGGVCMHEEREDEWVECVYKGVECACMGRGRMCVYRRG